MFGAFRLTLWTGMLLGFVFPCLIYADASLAAYYSFEEGPGDAVRDGSGNDNHGKIVGDVTHVKRDGGKGHALRFNTGQAYVDCGKGQSLDLRKALTLELWFRPESAVSKGEAGVVGKLMGSYCLSYSGKCWFYVPGGSNFAATTPLSQDWHHIVATFDGAEVRMYLDGQLRGVIKSAVKTLPAGENFYLRYPSTYLTVEPEFRCMLDNVRVYNRALSEAEAMRRYRDEARAMGLPDTKWFDRVKLTLLPFSQSGTVVVKADSSKMELPAPRPVVRVDLRNAAGKVAARKDIVPAPLTGGNSDAAIRFEFMDMEEQGVGYTTLDVHKLPPGKYVMRATASKTPGGATIGRPSSVALDLPLKRPDWIASYDGAVLLNNLVAELLNVKTAQVESQRDYKFTNPRDGWVFVAMTASSGGPVSLSIDGATEPAIVHDGTAGAREAMRHLPAGPHTLRVRCEGAARSQTLIVRAIPVMMVAGLGYAGGGGSINGPILPCFGHYNMEYLDRIGLLDNMNSIVEQNPVAENAPYVLEWRRQGKRLLSHYSQYSLWQMPPTSPDEVFNAWTAERGLKESGYDGVIADEFSGAGHGGSGSYPLNAESIRRMAKDPRFKGRVFYPYCMPMYTSNEAMDMLKAVTEAGYKWAEEKYLTEQPTEEAARTHMNLRLRQNLLRYEELIPGAARHMISTLGFMSAPPETLNIHPSVDFKVYMDMQMQLLATDPVFFGLHGIHWYHNGYVDEEDLRWTAKLFRHYGIEGHKDRLTSDPYMTAHVVNPDFDEKDNGWTLQPAEAGGISIGHAEGVGMLETRTLGSNAKIGDNFLLTTRSAKAPNQFSQTIKGLTPGRTYSVKMFTADHNEMNRGKSTKNPHSVSIQIANADAVPAGSFHQLFPSGLAGHVYGVFKDGNHLFLTYHRVVFRAIATEARLTVSDWESDTKPGGPVGQELMHNFVELQPYLENDRVE